MSKYTTEVRYICETIKGQWVDKTEVSVIDRCTAAAQVIFDADNEESKFGTDSVYRMYEAIKHPDVLVKILYHYYTREIGFETYGLWRQKINCLLRERLPEYKALYKSVDEEYSVFDDVNYTREYAGTNTSEAESESSNTSSADSKQTQKYSETPQGGLDGVESGKYLTTATIVENTNSSAGSGKSSTSGNGSTKSTETIKGKQGTASYSKMAMEYRQAVYNVDMKIIEDCAPLFMNVW